MDSKNGFLVGKNGAHHIGSVVAGILHQVINGSTSRYDYAFEYIKCVSVVRKRVLPYTKQIEILVENRQSAQIFYAMLEINIYILRGLFTALGEVLVQEICCNKHAVFPLLM